MRGVTAKTSDRVAEAQRMRSEGRTLREIAERFGIGVSTAGGWCTDPDGSESRARKRKYDLACVDCGKRVDGTTPGARGDREPRCVQCAARITGINKKVWSQARIVEAVRDWAELHGRVPTTHEWNPTTSHEAGHPEWVARYEAEPDRWPHFSTVLREFGSWRAAIEAAGFVPRERGRTLTVQGPTPEQLAVAADLYRQGARCVDIANRFGIHAETARKWLIAAGVPRRSRADYPQTAAA